MKPALLVIDVQKQFFESGSPAEQSLQEAAATINAAIALFRRKNLPVVSVQHVSGNDQLVPGKPGFDVVDILAVQPADLHIHKKRGSSFVETPLLDNLKALGVDGVILSGFCAEYCVLSTFRSAWDLDLHPLLLGGGLISENPDRIRFVEEINEVVSLEALEKMLDGVR